VARRFSSSQCNQVDAVVVPSTAMRAVLEKYGVKQRMDIIPTGIQVDERNTRVDPAKVQAFRQELGISMERPCLVHVGRIAFEKNIEFLIRVIAQVKQTIPDLAVIMAGEGPALSDIKAMVSQLELDNTVYFTGYLDRRTMLPVCYSAGDAFIFASRTETQGLVLLEAMALGIPVISTAVMGTRDILQPQQGALVAEDDVDDFAAKVIQMLHDRNLRSLLSKEASVYVHQWTSAEMAKRMLVFYDSVLENSQETLVLGSGA
ncbi:MAG: glycosyltransferase, partial [Gammaproteobacteria bacterium]